MTDYSELFLDLAAPKDRAVVQEALASAGGTRAWAGLQRAFLARIDAYVEDELPRPAEHLIDSHEAGGAWRIGFPHYHAGGDQRIVEHMARVMAARRAYADAKFYHGFPDEAEVHHEIETFIYFQIPLAFLGLQGSEAALASVEDVAHHTGNWVGGIPDWYDWATQGFRSTWLGTRRVRAEPPFDYQEANHFRFLATALAVYTLTKQERYLLLAVGYADRWCAHIEERATAGGPITCAILPPGALTEELGHAGKATDTSRYQVFYSTVAPNTAYEVAGGLLDMYRLTGNRRYLTCSRAMLDQFFAHGRDGRPALRYQDGAWQHEAREPGVPFGVRAAVSQNGAMLARPAIRHDLVTGEARYREAILAWARAIDERSVPADQIATDVLVGAHYYTGDAAWLARAYAMDLRTWAVVEQDPSPHMCNSQGRYGSKFLFEFSYQPILGGSDWGTRAGLPVQVLRHTTDGREGLPPGVAFRTWRAADGVDGFEAVGGERDAEWTLSAAGDGRVLASVRADDRSLPVSNGGYALRVPAGAAVRGTLRWERR